MNDPYRTHANQSAVFTQRFFPSFGVAPILLFTLMALPVAWLARAEGRAASTITCTTLADSDWYSPCQIHDARTIGTPERIACSDAPAAMEALIDSRNPFSRPYISAVVAESPAQPETTVVPAKGVFVNGSPMAVVKRVKHDPSQKTAQPLPKLTTDASGGISATDARTLLNACVANAGTSGPSSTQTVSLVIVDRNYLASALVMMGAFVLSILFSLRRRVRVSSDASGHVEIAEAGFFRTKKRVAVSAGQVERVEVVHGPAGPLAGSRVELLMHDGTRTALSNGFTAWSERSNTKLAARLTQLLHVSA